MEKKLMYQWTQIGPLLSSINTQQQLNTRVIVTGRIIHINEGVLIIDDSTGAIPVRMPDNKTFEPKDCVRVGGRIINSFVDADFACEIEDKWIHFHSNYIYTKKNNINEQAHEISSQQESSPKISVESNNQSTIAEEKIADPKEETIAEQQNTSEPNKTEQIIEFVRSLDKGDGASIQDIVDKSPFEAETIIQSLIETGDLFLVKPGKVKVLD